MRYHEAQAEAVRIEGETSQESRSESDKITHQWKQIQSRFVQYQKPVSTEPDQTYGATVVIVSMADVSTIMFSDYALYEENLRKVIGLVGEVALGLQSQILCGREYEEFSQQEDKLKVCALSLSFFLSTLSHSLLSLHPLFIPCTISISISLFSPVCISPSLYLPHSLLSSMYLLLSPSLYLPHSLSSLSSPVCISSSLPLSISLTLSSPVCISSLPLSISLTLSLFLTTLS